MVGHHIIKSSECGFKRLQSIHVFSAGSSIHSWPAVKICLFREDWNMLKTHISSPHATCEDVTGFFTNLWFFELIAFGGAWLQFNEDQILIVCLPSAHATLWSLAHSTPLLIRTSLSKRPWYLQSLEGCSRQGTSSQYQYCYLSRLLPPPNCPRLR